jgi:hypothetical protein
MYYYYYDDDALRERIFQNHGLAFIESSQDVSGRSHHAGFSSSVSLIYGYSSCGSEIIDAPSLCLLVNGLFTQSMSTLVI